LPIVLLVTHFVIVLVVGVPAADKVVEGRSDAPSARKKRRGISAGSRTCKDSVRRHGGIGKRRNRCGIGDAKQAGPINYARHGTASTPAASNLPHVPLWQL